MTQDALARLRQANSLAQTLTFEQLQAYHVSFDALTGESTVESTLGYWSSQRGRVAIVGESGTGKSSVMAACLGALSESAPEHLVPVRIPVELADSDAVTKVGPFCRHLVGHVLAAAAPEALTSGEKAELERRLADLERRSGKRRRGGFSLGTGGLLPIDVRLGGDLTGAATDLERRIGSGEAVTALGRLVELFRARGLEPFFVFDDTDAWLQLPGQEDEARERATGFFGTNVRMLTREIDCGFVLAVHRTYLDAPAYHALADSLEHIELPVMPEPCSGITEILQRRIEVDGLGIRVQDAFDDDAIVALALIYEDAPDLRRIMAIAGSAVRKAHDDEDAMIVSREAVFAARAERATFRGDG